MSISIWKVKYMQIYSSPSQDEFGFIEGNVPVSDDGTYEITKDYLSDLSQKFSEREDIKGLLKTFEKYVKSGKGYLSFRIF